MGLQSRQHVAVIGAGPAGLIAAERLVSGGLTVTIFDRMPSAARKFLMAGRGGLNLTHSEPHGSFMARYGDDAPPILTDAIEQFPPSALIAWAEGLGQETFVGSSGRVFPKTMKASPLLRAWLQRLGGLGVRFRLRTNLIGLDESGALEFDALGTRQRETFDAVVLALGGASWPRLGADGSWVSWLQARGIGITPLRPANVGVRVNWSDHLKQHFSGRPLKRVAIGLEPAGSKVRGEGVVTSYGLEGGVVYAIGEALQEQSRRGHALALTIDLKPDVPVDVLAARLVGASKKQSLSNTLRKQAGLDAVAIALLFESVRFAGALPRDAAPLAARIKSVTVPVDGFAGMSRAISTGGGLEFGEIDKHFMLKKMPGVFVAGEMLDWSAPTGGYLLQACFATGVAAGEGVRAWLASGRSLSQPSEV